ncbi:hypothetical protein ABZ801_27090 [Actinomadura sp. NPDC047616]|uniref:hypothetical protein n=1 Tax=Actinomadura sp. NPDC047616 TaxID=3155914 RepID=UPI0033C0F021
MDRLEASAWALSRGAFSVFVVAVVLKQVSWQIAFVVLMSAVAVWAFRAPAAVGAVLGVIAWMVHLGFDINKNGELVHIGAADAPRLAILVGVGVVSTLAGRPFRTWVAHGTSRSREAGVTENARLPVGVSRERVPGCAIEESRDV